MQLALILSSILAAQTSPPDLTSVSVGGVTPGFDFANFGHAIFIGAGKNGADVKKAIGASGQSPFTALEAGETLLVSLTESRGPGGGICMGVTKPLAVPHHTPGDSADLEFQVEFLGQPYLSPVDLDEDKGNPDAGTSVSAADKRWWLRRGAGSKTEAAFFAGSLRTPADVQGALEYLEVTAVDPGDFEHGFAIRSSSQPLIIGDPGLELSLWPDSEFTHGAAAPTCLVVTGDPAANTFEATLSPVVPNVNGMCQQFALTGKLPAHSYAFILWDQDGSPAAPGLLSEETNGFPDWDSRAYESVSRFDDQGAAPGNGEGGCSGAKCPRAGFPGPPLPVLGLGCTPALGVLQTGLMLLDGDCPGDGDPMGPPTSAQKNVALTGRICKDGSGGPQTLTITAGLKVEVSGVSVEISAANSYGSNFEAGANGCGQCKQVFATVAVCKRLFKNRVRTGLLTPCLPLQFPIMATCSACEIEIVSCDRS